MHEWMTHMWQQTLRNAASCPAGNFGEAGAINAGVSQAHGHSGCIGGAPTGWAASQPALYIHKTPWYMQLSNAPACSMDSRCAWSGRCRLVKPKAIECMPGWCSSTQPGS